WGGPGGGGRADCHRRADPDAAVDRRAGPPATPRRGARSGTRGLRASPRRGGPLPPPRAASRGRVARRRPDPLPPPAPRGGAPADPRHSPTSRPSRPPPQPPPPPAASPRSRAASRSTLPENSVIVFIANVS